CQQHNSHPLTC
nr:immunoglobulin light chain junction region [Macaca mulatta]MPO00728.1 immunoglobulin light chain junction region [Macaca mulatta]